MKRRKRRKKAAKPRLGRWLTAAACVAGLTGGFSWWLLAGESESGLRRACLEKISVIVDRVDELSRAWESREEPKSDPSAGRGKAAPSRPAPPARPQTRTEPPATAPSPASAPQDNITPEDKEELNKLLRELNQSP